MVSGKLHNEGSGFAREHLRFLENDTGKDNGGNTDEVRADGNPPCVIEERACDQADDWHFRAAGEERNDANGRFSFSFVCHCAGVNHSRYGTAEAHNHRHKCST